ncbi:MULTISPECIES: sigma-54 interaction domain-containing protein [Methylomonas]|uniref:Sigma-54 factor interaction domain-containing protein n=2 Tax=Methylomonas TaxID=416 RepID=A0A126T8R4_9GAMM|nr:MULTISPECIES: sigma 54-interacting transcriptional regulator [Methylomonas]AMK78450.1 hypothetical protein JT25_018460 [Methylomonas denitrificans]OAI04152.1 hypothetical protein A1342_06385 [Methylomonas methanica]TCV87520.1 two-component system response regulator AtoC [Methylomonas methanica]
MISAVDLYQAFFNTFDDCVFVVDVNTGTIFDANAKALEATGLAPEDLKRLDVNGLLRTRAGDGIGFKVGAAFNKMALDDLLLVSTGGFTIRVNVSVTRIECKQSKYLVFIAQEVDKPQHIECIAPDTADVLWSQQQDFPTIIGQSEKIREVCRIIGAVAKTDATVLLQGQSGTGKEVIAAAIHMHSLRGRNPFVKVNCAALSEMLLESELFGHVKGAFTGAIRDRCGRFKQADGGTILLDEIGSMSLSGQAKLLRVLQEQEFEAVGSSVTTSVNVRVIASTNIDLAKAAADGKFREDLYYRLNVFSILLPPLRDRKEDIPLLIQHFLEQHSRNLGKEIQAVAPQTQAMLMEHNWPGNVRELENVIEHAAIVEQGPTLLPASLPINLTKAHLAENDNDLTAMLGLREKLILFERQVLLDTLLRANGVKKITAEMLGIDARNLPYLLRKHHLGY